MKVETFEITEMNSAGEVENFEETKSLADKLGLSKQLAFFKPTEVGTTQVFPYRKVTKQELLVYTTLCPCETKLADYGDSVIPLRILQVIAHVNELNFVDELYLWHPENADYKDPILVGKVWKDKANIGSKYSTHENYLLGRWGDELESLDIMSKKALQVIKEKATLEFKEVLETVKFKGANIETLIEKKFALGERFSVSFYCS
jgi:hypothetical protein